MTYDTFIFEQYHFDADTGILDLFYSFDDDARFHESYTFDIGIDTPDRGSVDRACQLVFFVSGVSYYKAYLAPKIEVRSGEIDLELASFLSGVYENGLRECLWKNGLDVRREIPFPVTSQRLTTVESGAIRQGKLVALSGGKDSLTSIELLRRVDPGVKSWTVGHREQLEPLVESVGLPHTWVDRRWDRAILDHNAVGAYNGHIPISAILAAVGVLVGILSGTRDLVVSNESSASEASVTVDGVEVNHQYSKSIHFEKEFQRILLHMFGEEVRYYSILRPFCELRIAEMFAVVGLDKYFDRFGSCNKSFVHGSGRLSWCGTCPKCEFTFLALSPFVEKERLMALFGGRNLLELSDLDGGYQQLLGIEGTRPFDCVGGVMECRKAMREAASRYPEVNRFLFDLDEQYDFRSEGPDCIPDDVRSGFFDAVRSMVTR